MRPPRCIDDRLPWLVGLHTPAEDRWFYRERVFPTCAVWGALARGKLVGALAFRAGWVDQLYVAPSEQGRGVGRALLAIAQSSSRELRLWALQHNLHARRFYERRGFMAIETTDGAGNEEHEPDVL
jgi:GNAT superfamily N-acetyltransferase